jgi:hypothetical protein
VVIEMLSVSRYRRLKVFYNFIMYNAMHAEIGVTEQKNLYIHEW